MRLTRIHIQNFKSLVDFKLELEPLTCLVGLNGCGKSTVLEAFDFIAAIFSGLRINLFLPIRCFQ